MRTTPRLTSWGCGEGVRGRRKATALRRLDYEECIGAKKQLEQIPVEFTYNLRA